MSHFRYLRMSHSGDIRELEGRSYSFCYDSGLTIQKEGPRIRHSMHAWEYRSYSGSFPTYLPPFWGQFLTAADALCFCEAS